MEQKNLERWKYYLREFGSPEAFKLWGFYSMVSSILQRRVIIGSERKPLHTNMYTVLTGPAGVGKGMILGEVSNILRHSKLKKQKGLEESREKLMNELKEEGEELGAKAKNTNNQLRLKNMIIPMAPNATTFEALTRVIADCASPLSYIDPNGNRRVTFHSSLCIHLEEMGSLFRKHTEDIHTLLCEMYDCKNEFEYRTKHQGTDYITNPCINLLAGTTPDFLRRVFSSSLLTEGFASRTVFVVALKNAFRRFDPPTFNADQIKEHELIVDQMVELAKLKGVCNFTPEALEFFKAIYEDENFHAKRANNDPKLDPFYARWNITAMKLAAAIHFGDSVTMSIPLEPCIESVKVLREAELSMHHALHIESKNPLSIATNNVLKYMKTHGRAKRKELKTKFYDDMPKPDDDIQTILDELVDRGEIKLDPSGEPHTYINNESQKQ